MLWNSKSKINLAAVESAKPQKSLTLARNAQRSGCSTSIYSVPFPALFTVLLYSLPLCLIMFFCLQFSIFFFMFSSQSFPLLFIVSLHVDTSSFICTCHFLKPNPRPTILFFFFFPHFSVGLFLFQTLGGDLALGSCFLSRVNRWEFLS